jgi:hypothetical protein
MLEMNTIKRHFIGILLLVCATVIAQTPSGKPTVTTYKFGPNDERHVDMEDADVCVEAGRFYYDQAFKAGSLEEASILLNQSITLLQRALELRTKNGLASERAIIHNHLAEAFMAAARLFPNDIRTATAYHHKAAEQEEAILLKFKEEAEGGHEVTAVEIKKAFDEARGKETGRGYIYMLLKRHGWRKVMPRSKHPKAADEEACEASKKLSKRCWMPEKTCPRNQKEECD